MSESLVLFLFLMKLIGYTLAGYLFARFMIPARYFVILNKFIFNAVMPSLVFSSMIKSFSWAVLRQYGLLIFFQPFFIGVAYLVYRVFVLGHFSAEERKVNFGTYAFQNSGYIPIALFSVLLPASEYPVMLNLIFMMLIGFNLIMFSFGESLFSGGPFDPKIMVNTVIVTIFVSAAIALSGHADFVPPSMVHVADLIGSLTVPLVMLSLGASIYFSSRCGASITPKTLIRLFVGKALLFPLVGLLIIKLFSLSGLMALFVFVQFLMPPAANLVVLARNSENLTCLVGGYITYAYLMALFYVPLWLMGYYYFLR